MTRKFIRTALIKLLYYYLSLVYLTIRWRYVVPKNYSIDDFAQEKSKIFVLWHNQLALGPHIFRSLKGRIFALVSSHSDGKIISAILKDFCYNAIEGSTNRNPVAATKQILNALSHGLNVAITPDGPRGPAHKINSQIIRVANLARSQIIPIACHVNFSKKLNSWDKLIIPLPFSKGTVVIGSAVLISTEISNSDLQQQLSKVNTIAGLS